MKNSKGPFQLYIHIQIEATLFSMAFDGRLKTKNKNMKRSPMQLPHP